MYYFRLPHFHLPSTFLLRLLLRSRKDSLESESSAAIVPHELVRTRQLESVHLKFNQEAGTLLPLCLRYDTLLLHPQTTSTALDSLQEIEQIKDQTEFQ